MFINGETAEIKAVDLTVKTVNPELLDRTVQQLGPAVVVEGSFNGETCTVRVLDIRSTGYLKFAITNQGYGEIVSEQPVN